jgi:hypothetical protein
MRVPADMYPDIVMMYTVDFLSCGEIGEKIGCSRVRIHQILNGLGVDTSKRQRKAEVPCAICSKPVLKHKCQLKVNRKNYCSHECYHKAIASPGYQQWRQGTRYAREIVNKVFRLDPGNVVHHMDGDQGNNSKPNLFVFETAADHGAYHRSSRPIRAFSLKEFDWVTLENTKF